MSHAEPAKTQQRIVNAATELFSNSGYNGVSTRDIARLAEVNETSIYRYYPCKRDLFIATVDAEFSRVQLRADLSSKLAAAPDAHAAMLALFQVLMEAVLQRRPLVRLVQFSVLEFGENLDDLYRRHLRRILQAVSECLVRWPEMVESRESDTPLLLLGFVATLVALQDFHPVLTSEQAPPESFEKAAHRFADLWHAALALNGSDRAKSILTVASA